MTRKDLLLRFFLLVKKQEKEVAHLVGPFFAHVIVKKSVTRRFLELVKKKLSFHLFCFFREPASVTTLASARSASTDPIAR